jgi:hypothetical protein
VIEHTIESIYSFAFVVTLATSSKKRLMQFREKSNAYKLINKTELVVFELAWTGEIRKAGDWSPWMNSFRVSYGPHYPDQTSRLFRFVCLSLRFTYSAKLYTAASSQCRRCLCVESSNWKLAEKNSDQVSTASGWIAFTTRPNWPYKKGTSVKYTTLHAISLYKHHS